VRCNHAIFLPVLPSPFPPGIPPFQEPVKSIKSHFESVRTGYDQRVDWWAFGCVLYEMLFAASPFVTNDLKTTFTRICDAASGKLPSNMKDDLNQTDEAAAKFLRGLICNKENRLASSGDLTDITDHDYFDDFGW